MFGYDAANQKLTTVAVTYHDFSDDDTRVLNGTEQVGTQPVSTYVTHIDWQSDLHQTVTEPGAAPLTVTKLTSPGGFSLTISLLDNLFDATGTITTTVGDQSYRQPANGT